MRPCPCPLTFPQFSNMIQWDTFMLSLLNAQVYFLMNIHYGPKSIVTLSLSSLSLNSGARSLTVTLTLPLHSALQLCTHLIAKYCTRSFFYNFAHILLQTLHKKLFSQLWAHLITKYCTRYCLQLCAHVIAKYCARNFARNGNFSLQNKFSNLS